MSESASGRASEWANVWIMMCLLSLLGLCASCVTSERPSFRLHILEGHWYELELGYEREQAWDILKDVDLKDSAVVITENDIERYDWSVQSITLTSAASDRLNKAFTDTEYPSINLSNRGFAVTFRDAWLYGGVFLDFGSAMPIQYPVIYTKSSGDSIIFLLRPSHPIPTPYDDLDSSYKSIIEIQEVHDFFTEQGKLVE